LSGDDALRRDVTRIGPVEDEQPRDAAGQTRVGRHDEQVAHWIDRDTDHLQQLRLGPLDRTNRRRVAVRRPAVDEDAAIAGMSPTMISLFFSSTADGFGTRQPGPGALNRADRRLFADRAAAKITTAAPADSAR